jgi:hypothetical protein
MEISSRGEDEVTRFMDLEVSHLLLSADLCIRNYSLSSLSLELGVEHALSPLFACIQT